VNLRRDLRAPAAGHREIQDENVRLQLARAPHRFLSVRRFPDHRKAELAVEQHSNAVAHDRVIVREHDSHVLDVVTRRRVHRRIAFPRTDVIHNSLTVPFSVSSRIRTVCAAGSTEGER
jgi:hypothetical protein